MLQLSQAGKRFGPKVLFQGLDWLITPRDRVGLVGANGTGKTTLLKVLAGLEGLDYGNITRQRGANTGYLPQDGLTLSGRTVFAECLSVFSEIHAMQREQEELAHRMAEVDHSDSEYAQIAEREHGSVGRGRSAPVSCLQFRRLSWNLQRVEALRDQIKNAGVIEVIPQSLVENLVQGSGLRIRVGGLEIRNCQADPFDP